MNTWPARRVICVDEERCAMPVCDCKECPAPQACELPDVESMNHYWMVQRRVIALAVAACAAAVMLALFGV